MRDNLFAQPLRFVTTSDMTKHPVRWVVGFVLRANRRITCTILVKAKTPDEAIELALATLRDEQLNQVAEWELIGCHRVGLE